MISAGINAMALIKLQNLFHNKLRICIVNSYIKCFSVNYT